MTTSRFLISLVALALVLATWPGAARARQQDAFQDHLDQAVSLYKGGQYEDAIKEFQAAYAMRQMPRLLLNLGQAHRKLGHAREALGYYEFYLRVEPSPKPELRTELEGYIAQARAMIQAAERAKAGLSSAQQEERAEAGPPAPSAAPPPAQEGAPAPPRSVDLGVRAAVSPAVAAAPPPPQRAPAPRPIYKRWYFWTALAAGAVVAGAVATGAVLGTRGPGVPEGIEIHGLTH